MPIVNPLPQRFLTSHERIGGTLKTRPEDFVVEELPLYEPCGEGEHLYLQVQKMNVSHAELTSCLRRAFNVTDRHIGYAGMKDKRAVTSQTVSLHLTSDPSSLDLGHERINVLWATRHRNKLRRGHLLGNRFSIRVRDVDPLKAPVALRTLRELERSGAPTYFGVQRFGYRRNTHLLGRCLLEEDWAGALAELLGTGGAPFPEYQRERREHFEAGRYREAAAQWSAADRSELIASKSLGRGASPKQAIAAIGKPMLGFWSSAAISAAFNRVLDERIDDGTVDQLLEGDLAWRHESRKVFAVTADELASGELEPRLARIEISPSGPLWGVKMRRAAGRIDEVERMALEATGIPPERLDVSPYRPEGARRPLRTSLRNTEVEGGFDEHGPHLRVAFDLPRGMYATVALREVMGDPDEAGRFDSWTVTDGSRRG